MKAFPPDSPLTEACERYQHMAGRKYRNGSSSCRTFDKLMGKMRAADITIDILNEFIERAEKKGYAQTTIGRLIGDIKTIVKFVDGRQLLPDSVSMEFEPITDPAEASLPRWAREYVDRQNITRKEPIYSANRFQKYMGPVKVGSVTTETLSQFRKHCQENTKLTPRTIESTVCDIITLVKAATEIQLKPGRRLRVPRPVPKPVTIADLETVFPDCPEWLQQFIAISYWTALRLADVMRLQLQLTNQPPEALTFTASKTGHTQQWPIPDWLLPWLVRRELPFARVNDNAFKRIRNVIADSCFDAGVPAWKPKYLRQLALSQWFKVNPAAGQIVHGCGLNGVLKNYIDAMTILNEAAPKMPVPECFRIGDEQPAEHSQPAGEDAHTMIEQLDEKTRAAMVQMMKSFLSRLA